MLGKLGYMPPEQLQPRSELTRAADVYATGVILWELVAGRRLFPNDGYEIPSLILKGVIQPPSIHRRRRDETLRTEEMDAMDRLDAIVLRAIDRDPSRRFPTARDMAEEVEAAVGPAPQSAMGAWVEMLAMDALSERTARVAEIERQSVTLDSGSRSVSTALTAAARRGPLRVGDTAPDIDAMTTTGARFILSNPRRTCMCTVIYFFPKAFTPLCGQEARGFRDNHEELSLAGAELVGISTDDYKTQCAFATSVGARFPMIADADGTVSRAYGVLWPIVGRAKRITFVVDDSRKVLAVFRHELRITRHRDDVLLFVDRLFQDRRARARG
jgi:peroxiredoxin